MSPEDESLFVEFARKSAWSGAGLEWTREPLTEAIAMLNDVGNGNGFCQVTIRHMRFADPNPPPFKFTGWDDAMKQAWRAFGAYLDWREREVARND
jgi:hypothetical protein